MLLERRASTQERTPKDSEADDEDRQALFREMAQHGIIGECPALLSAWECIKTVSPTDASVLLLGESGTGKEVFARAIHDKSPRANRPFNAVNCAAIPRELMESELFGHERGAFTGAATTRKGRFETANGGTIFLDEIGDMPPDMQVKLLRVLQNQVIERVGSTKSIRVNVRIIAATNHNLESDIGEGNFRLDLFHRLCVFPVYLPPLRDRGGDIAMLTRHFVRILATEHGKSGLTLDSEAVCYIERLPWRGNIRELRNFIERLIIRKSDGARIMLGDVEAATRQGRRITRDESDTPTLPTRQWVTNPRAPEVDFKAHRMYFEYLWFRAALERNDGNVTQAAHSLQLSPASFYQKWPKLKHRFDPRFHAESEDTD